MEVPLVLSGCYFLVLGIWWTMQSAKIFIHTRQRRLEFTSTVTFPCCRSCNKVPLEGIFKLVFCFGLMVFCVATASDFGTGKFKIRNYDGFSHATIFLFFTLSSVIDIMKHLQGKLFLEDLDYAVLAMTFAVQGILYGFHVPDAHAEEWTVYNLMMMSAFICCVATVIEVKVRNHIFCPLLRSFTMLTMGSWLIHSAIILQEKFALSEDEQHKRVITLSMYYTWHLAVDFGILMSTWIVTQKLVALNRCCCVPSDIDPHGDVVFLENRIRFDYHIIDRMESDVD